MIAVLRAEIRSAPEWTPEGVLTALSALAKLMMTERDWELYRLSVVARLPESPYKEAVIAGIQHKLSLIERDEPRALPIVSRATS